MSKMKKGLNLCVDVKIYFWQILLMIINVILTWPLQDQYKKETTVGTDGVPQTREYHTRKRLNSPREIDLGYIEDNRDYMHTEHLEPNTSYFQEKYRQEFEPKSLDSQFSEMNRSSPEQNYRIGQPVAHRSEKFQSLAREKKLQRSFDKGDSGIENDYRKDSFNDGVSSRWKRRTTRDEIKASEIFLKRERQHSEQLHSKRFGYIFRERSIDDGSHFDPRLDKYPSGTLKNNRTEKLINKSS